MVQTTVTGALAAKSSAETLEKARWACGGPRVGDRCKYRTDDAGMGKLEGKVASIASLTRLQ
jgi:hypothetical protein